ncbi:alpha/beta fold hydrolase [Streptomyces sp. NPDC048389]|uniref:alpha/beta fold hydrolase n=1 Tax=Streptomyces sp. NPDC048389 TaxID=3154622 RepID=UPI003452D045
MNRARDLIVMAQRGALHSQPNLACPEIDRFYADVVGLRYDAPSTGRLLVRAATECRDRLTADGVDLSAYNTTENAADFADLRKALGIHRWNVYGYSYGTDLALTFLRRHPEGIRSVTIDSVVPPQIVSLPWTWDSAREGIGAIFAACEAQPRCKSRYPDLLLTLTEQVRRLEAQPLTLTARPPGGKDPVKVVLDGGALVNLLIANAVPAVDVPAALVLASFLTRPTAPDTSCVAGLAPKPFTITPAPESTWCPSPAPPQARRATAPGRSGRGHGRCRRRRPRRDVRPSRRRHRSCAGHGRPDSGRRPLRAGPLPEDCGLDPRPDKGPLRDTHRSREPLPPQGTEDRPLGRDRGGGHEQTGTRPDRLVRRRARRRRGLRGELAIDGGLNRDRDVIFMSQRGTYSADPALTCPDIDEFTARAVGLVPGAPSTGRLHVKATRACREQSAERTDLSAYNTTESAADYAALRVALGIEQWHMFGISYGTDLALTYMREHPKGIRSVGIDGVLPPSLAGASVTWSAARQGFDGLFRACAEQPACNRRYPNLSDTFERLVRELEAKPLTTTVTVPGRATPVKVVLDGGVLVNWLTSATRLAARVPRSIDELARGNPQRIAEQWAGGKLSPQAVGRLAHGLAYGVFCSEWTPFETEADVIRAGRPAFPSFPRSVLANAPQLPFLHADCRAWDVPAAPRPVREVTRSDIPTLVMSAGFDAQTAAGNGTYATLTLSRSTAVTVPYVVHVAFAESPCAQAITASFFESPTAPDTRRLAGLQPPEFEVGP